MSPGQPDAAVVRRHLLALDDAVRHLRRHTGRPLSVLESDIDERWSVQHGLQLCAQNVLDIATHLAASAGRDAPNYGHAIEALGDLRVIPAEFLQKLRGIAGFRNVLVHGYLGVDLARLHRLLNSSLDDFVDFARFIETYLQRA